MKNVYSLITLMFITFMASFFSSCRQKSKTSWKAALLNDERLFEEEKETDGPAQYLHREYLMTVDPLTLDIPTERLKVAEELMEKRMQSSRIEASNILWEERGPDNIGGRTRAILIDKNDNTGNTVWAGGAGGGLWKTTNFKGACNWTLVSGIFANLAITCIAQDPLSPGTIYAGTGEGFNNIDAVRGLGVYKSTDGGNAWHLLPSTTTAGPSVNNFYYVNKLLVYSNGDVYAATRSNYCNTGGGIMKSINGGVTWTRVIGTTGGSCAASINANGFDIEMSVGGDLYATTRTPGSTGIIWKSPAGANIGNTGTWVNITPAGTFKRIDIACSPYNNNKIYALTQGSGNGTGGARRSLDGGTTWSPIDVGNWCDNGSNSVDFTRGQAWYDLVLGINPADDAIVYAGGVDIFRTANSGNAWVQLTQWSTGCNPLPYVHADIHAIEFLPNSALEFIVGCDGGIFYTADGGITFTEKNGGYNVTQYYSVAIHPSAGFNYMLGGTQDNGSHKFSGPGINAVTKAAGGDGGFCHIDSDNPLYQYASYTGSSVIFSSNGGNSFNYLGSYTADRFINPSDYDASTDHLYGGGAGRNVRRIYNFTSAMTANSFTTASTTNLSVSAIKVDPNTPNRVWAAFSTADGAGGLVAPELYRLDNMNNPNIPVITAIVLPAGISATGNYISSLDIENGNADHIILTLSNYGVTSIWESTDGGTNWTSIEGNLPDMPVRWCMFMPAGSPPNSRVEAVGGMLIATEMGVWSTNNINGAATNWVPNTTGMGVVRTDMIRMRASDNKIIVGTHGRGVFTGTILSPLPVVLTTFKATAIGKNVRLDWTTSSEYNSKHFVIEKSFNGVEYRPVATVPASENSNTLKHYSYLDKEPMAELNYYRLRSTDLDGAYKLSNIELIKFTKTGQDMLVLGNPFKDKLVIRFVKAPETNGHLTLTDMSGKLLASRNIVRGEQQIEFVVKNQALARGAYILQATFGKEKFTSKVISQ